MTKNKDNLWRYILVGALFAVVAAFYVGVFIDLQVSGQDYYSMAIASGNKTRTVKIQAQRGEIYDRNGKKLVGNEFYYDLKLDYSSMPKSTAEKNRLLLSLAQYLDECGDGECRALAKYTPLDIEVGTDGLNFSYNEGFFELVRARKYIKLADELGIKDDADANEAAKVFMKRYGLLDSDGNLVLSPEESAFVFLYRMDFEMFEFSPSNPYVFAKDISEKSITAIKESNFKGVNVHCGYNRVYYYPGYASHILGRVAKINQDNLDYYTALGYPMDTLVGSGGCEASFELYLHGIDGELTITEDSFGNVIKTEVTKEAVAGLDVYLTIDIDLQMAAEDSLHYNIEYVKNQAQFETGVHRGEDAEVGALTAVNPKNGEVLVLASYPTYDLSSFSADFSYISTDTRSPMMNRALEGLYQPGSTFKPGVALAALTEGIISEYSIIDTKGKYEFYETYQPRCWLYLMSGQTHGKINVTEALQESCNYFFYEVGRILTIEKINEYMGSMGLGKATGVELPEKTGILAGPDYRKANALDAWNPGDTLQASIGQSDNLFSPLQMSMYVSSIVNNGSRYGAHILLKVCPFGSSEALIETQPEIIEVSDVPEYACTVVKNAMRDVIENGSASEIFEDYPITIGGKTGTAQVSEHKSDNAIFTAFAPFDNPEIVVTCVIEQGNTGANAGVSVKGVFDHYFGLDKVSDEDADEDSSVTDENEDTENGEEN